MAKTNPTHEAKSTRQYSKEGINLRDLIAQQAGGADRASFDNLLKSSGLSRRDMRRLGKAFDTVQSSNRDYILSEDGSGFNVFDKGTGAAEVTSGRGKGNTKGVNLADLVQLGDNISKLAGFASRGISDFNKSKNQPESSAPTSEMRTSSVNTDNAVPVDLVDYKPSTASKGKGKVQVGTTKTPPVKSTAVPEQPAPQTGAAPDMTRFNELLAKYNSPEHKLSSRPLNESKLSEHMKGVENAFRNRLVGMGSYNSFAMGPGSVSTNSLKANTDVYAKRASAIYEGMVRDGFQPDIEEIASFVNNNELEQIQGGLETNLNNTLTVMALGRLGTFGFRLGKAGVKSLAGKYPNFAKWLAQKGVAKPLQFPATQSTPSVTGGAKRFLEYMKPIQKASQRMRGEGGGGPGGGFGRGGRIPIINDAQRIGLNSAMNSAVHRYVSQTWNPKKKQQFSLKTLMNV